MEDKHRSPQSLFLGEGKKDWNEVSSGCACRKGTVSSFQVGDMKGGGVGVAFSRLFTLGSEWG